MYTHLSEQQQLEGYLLMGCGGRQCEEKKTYFGAFKCPGDLRLLLWAAAYWCFCVRNTLVPNLYHS